MSSRVSLRRDNTRLQIVCHSELRRCCTALPWFPEAHEFAETFGLLLLNFSCGSGDVLRLRPRFDIEFAAITAHQAG